MSESLDYYSKKMLNKLEKKTKLSYNEFQREMTASPKAVMSPKTFRERLKQLQSSGLVTRTPDDHSDKVWYTLDPGVFEAERALFDKVQADLDEMDNVYERMEKEFDKNSPPLIEKAVELGLMMRELAQIECRLRFLKILFPKNPRFRVLFPRIEKSMCNLFHLTHVGSYDQRIPSIIYRILAMRERKLIE